MKYIRDHALDLARRGFKVFPLRAGMKLPRTPDWQLQATSDEAQVMEMWSGVDGEPQNFNIGISTRGYLVVDADVKDGREGIAICELLGLELDTFVVQSPSGGRHYYYSTDTPIGNSAQKIGDGVDVRGDGGFVVGPGSILDPVYAENRGVSGRYTILADNQIKDAPTFLKSSAGKRRERAEVFPNTGLDDPSDIAAGRVWLESHPPAIEGEAGDLHTFKTAASLRQRGLSPNVIFGLMWDHWNERCEPPWEMEDLQAKIASAFKSASGSPGESSVAVILEDLKNIRSPALSDPNWFFHGDAIDKNTAWLIKDVLPASGIGILSGPSYSGKTFVALDIARAVALQTAFFGAEVDYKGGTIIVAGEGMAGMRRRLAALDHGDQTLLPIAGRSAVGLDEDEVFAEFARDLAAKMKAMKEDFGVPVRLLVFDTLSSTGLVRDENDNSEMARMMAKIGQLATKLDTVAIITHHPAANGKTERGATAIFNNADFVIRIERDDPEDPVRSLQLAKQKEGEAPKTLGYFKLPTRLLGYDAKEREVRSCYVEPCEQVVQEGLRKPENYDNWFSDIDFQATVTNEYGQRYVSRKVALDNWKGDGRSAKAFENCEKYAIQKGDIAPGRNDSGAIITIGEVYGE